MGGIKYVYKANPFYTHLKKHYCPKCDARLKLRYVSKFVNSKSSEAKQYDFSLGDTYLTGDVEFRTRCFYCPNCFFTISFKDMKKLESKQIKSKNSEQ